jgi:hypothetical protein
MVGWRIRSFVTSFWLTLEKHSDGLNFNDKFDMLLQDKVLP